MLKSSEIKLVSKDDHPRHENVSSQPINHQKIFNEPYLITESWYPVCPSSKLENGMARSFTLLSHRFVVWRGKSGKLQAMDSFCPHMGADLGNGNVVGDNLQCYFHHWTFTGEGKCSHVRDGKADLCTYPVEEKYGYIWVYPAKTATHSLPLPPGMDSFGSALHLKTIKLYAHHHVMMVGGIDLQHFKSVHHLDIKFDYKVENPASDVYVWNLQGEIPNDGFMTKFARFITGGEFKYKALFAGGSIVSLTYGNDLKFRGTGFKLPSVNILWGCKPAPEGISEVDIFLVTPDYKGVLAPLKKAMYVLFSAVLLNYLKDDDIKAFPHMRFNLGHTTKEDQSVMDLVDKINSLKVSSWTKDSKI